ncbi:hypothetical protein D3C76_967340 [compost metagenome]
MQRASPAETGIDEITWVSPPPDEDLLHRLRHVFRADADHPLGGRQRRQADLFCQAVHCLLRGGDI